MTITIYHNPQCSNSRAALALIRAAGIEPQVIAYLQQPPSRATLLGLARDAGVPLRALMRSKEPAYIDAGLDDEGTDEQRLLAALQAHPELLNRPIVVSPRGTRLCRPPERVLDLLPV